MSESNSTIEAPKKKDKFLQQNKKKLFVFLHVSAFLCKASERMHPSTEPRRTHPVAQTQLTVLPHFASFAEETVKCVRPLIRVLCPSFTSKSEDSLVGVWEGLTNCVDVFLSRRAGRGGAAAYVSLL